MKSLLALALVMLIAGCTQPEPVTEIIIPGHGNQIYAFANNIHESLLVPSNDPAGIKQIGNDFTNIFVVFNGANETDNAYSRVVIFDFISKILPYYSYEGKYISLGTYYYVGDQWYNATGGKIPAPVVDDPVIWIVGPSEAMDTSVNLNGNKIYVSGTSYRNLTLAGDKLTLLFFGIDNI